MHATLVVAVALLASVPRRPRDAGRMGRRLAFRFGVSVPSCRSADDGAAELAQARSADRAAREHPSSEIALLLERAAITGALEDYQRRARATPPRSVAATPERASRGRCACRRSRASTVRRRRATRSSNVDARARRARARRLDRARRSDRRTRRGLPRRDAGSPRTTRARRNADLCAATRSRRRAVPTSAIALIPKAATTVRDNPPELIAWLLFPVGPGLRAEGRARARHASSSQPHTRDCPATSRRPRTSRRR